MQQEITTTPSDEQIRMQWEQIDSHVINETCALLRKYEYLAFDYLAELIAALCDVSVEELFAQCRAIEIAHARWFFWYSYRRMTGESYAKIAARASNRGHVYANGAVQYAIEQMSQMIGKEQNWVRRWNIVKRWINIRNESIGKKRDTTIVVQVPAEIKDEINIVIKEK